ncbi:MAG TPA: methyltransferase domain-containing protein [Pyrinomonadaceae bacterium]|nr:methyltransferase domain-containing protein [Pyrinomonadaceae bacterium]
MNLFASGTAAERYAKGRPYFHPRVIGRVKEFLPSGEPLPRGLDVCCGTGHSSVALKEVAAHVVGADASAEMLARAPKDEVITFILAEAERLPFGVSAFDILSICQALHWLDKRKFLAEARRILRADGWLVVYDNFMTGRMAESEDFVRWFKDSYVAKFPSPRRNWVLFDEGETEGDGFHLRFVERFDNAIVFTPESLIDFLTSHSNIIAAVEGSGGDIEEVRAWLAKEIGPFFGGMGKAHFVFDAAVWCLQRAE